MGHNAPTSTHVCSNARMLHSMTDLNEYQGCPALHFVVSHTAKSWAHPKNCTVGFEELTFPKAASPDGGNLFPFSRESRSCNAIPMHS